MRKRDGGSDGGVWGCVSVFIVCIFCCANVCLGGVFFFFVVVVIVVEILVERVSGLQHWLG